MSHIPRKCESCGRMTRGKHEYPYQFDVVTVTRGRGELCQRCTTHADGKYKGLPLPVIDATPDPAIMAGLNSYLAKRNQRLNAGSVATR